MVEIWKLIEEAPSYSVSSLGRVKRVKTGRILKSSLNSDGYPQVILCAGLSQKLTRRIHRLVAETFIPNPLGKPDVNHLNEDKQDARVVNLEWCTKSENMRYNNLNRKIAKLREKPAIAIKISDGEVMGFSSVAALCEALVLDKRNVYKVISGERSCVKGYCVKLV